MKNWILAVAFLLFTYGIAYSQATPTPTPGSGPCGGLFTNIQQGPGCLQLQGATCANGQPSYVSGTNINGILNATQYPGADIGAKTNAAIAALGAQGGSVYIPSGSYTFTTTIQCPITNIVPVDIWGAGKSSADEPGLSTVLNYTGNGDAVNQVITNQAWQNYSGCRLHNLTLLGASAGSLANGFHFGGTSGSGTFGVTVSQFKHAGIEMENAANMWTERWNFNDTSLYHNVNGIFAHCDPSCSTSFAHGTMNIVANVMPTNNAVVMDGGAAMVNGVYTVDGNIEGAGSGGTLFSVLATNSYLQNDVIMATMECNETSCTRFGISPGSTVAVRMLSELVSAGSPGNWVDYNAGATQYVTGMSAGSTINSAGTIEAGTSNPLPDSNLGDIWSMRGPTSGEYLFGSNTPASALDYGISYPGAFAFTGGGLVVPFISNQCSGVVALSGGTAVVNNSCISTGRPMICTDNSALNPVRCQNTAAGQVTIFGTATDIISWARQ